MKDKSISIKAWYGQFGNNLRQLTNAYMLSELYDTNVIYKAHDLLKPSQLKNKEIIFNDIFFRPVKELENKGFTDDDRMNISTKYIRPLLENIPDLVKVPKDVIVVHIRGGSAIFGNRPHKGYPQPPLDYYVKIFNHIGISDYSKVWVVCSNQIPRNPIIKLLEKLGCTIKETPIEESISIIANSTTFVSAMSTFSKQLFFLSQNAKKIYYPDYFRYNFKRIESYEVSLPKYIKRGQWKANKEQINLMHNYKSAKINKI